jgi:hypothetical protein
MEALRELRFREGGKVPIRSAFRSILSIVMLGVVPTYLVLQHGDWVWWLCYALFLIAGLSLGRLISNIASALNIVMAQTTYCRLSEDEQMNVDIVAEHIYSVYEHDPEALFESQFQRMGYVALAMRDMRIAPVIFFDKWLHVQNPSKLPPLRWIAKTIAMTTNELATTPNSSASH